MTVVKGAGEIIHWLRACVWINMRSEINILAQE